MPESIRIEGRIVKVLAFCLGLGVLMGQSECAWAAFERTAQGVSASGRAGAGLALSEPGSFLLNPAMCGATTAFAGWSQPFGLKEFGTEFLGASHRFSNWGAALLITQMGDEAYREQSLKAASTLRVRNDLDLGIAANWQRIDIAEFPKGDAVSVDLGMLARIQEDVRFGAVWHNATRSQLSNYEDRLPESIATGLCIDADSRTTVVIDALQESGRRLEFRGGVEVAAMKPLILRGGVLFDPAQYAFGFTLRHRGIRVNYGLQWHRTLGASHFAGLDILLK